MSEPYTARGEPAQEGPPHGVGRYNSAKWKCRCDVCKLAKRNWRFTRLGELDKVVEIETPRTRPRPPGVVWVDATDYTAVVRCERCDKNYGTWVLDREGALAFAREHAYLHAGEPPFDWASYDRGLPAGGPKQGRPQVRGGMCSEDACTAEVQSKGLCNKHYMRVYRSGASL